MSGTIDFDKLREPFPAADIEWRVARSGKAQSGIWVQVLAYVTNRAIQERLDNVCRPENWRNEFSEWHDAEQLCGISIRVDSEWVTKWDGAEKTQVEGTKGGLSGAMKRAAVQWGIGRYLYYLPSPNWADIQEHKGSHRDRVKYKEGNQDKEEWVNWNPPSLAQWALPGGSGKPGVASPPPSGKPNGTTPKRDKWGPDRKPQGNGTQQPAQPNRDVEQTRNAIADANDDFVYLRQLDVYINGEVKAGNFSEDIGHELQGLLNQRFLPITADRIDQTPADNCDKLIAWIVSRRFGPTETGDLIKLVKTHKEQLAAATT